MCGQWNTTDDDDDDDDDDDGMAGAHIAPVNIQVIKQHCCCYILHHSTDCGGVSASVHAVLTTMTLGQ